MLKDMLLIVEKSNSVKIVNLKTFEVNQIELEEQIFAVFVPSRE